MTKQTKTALGIGVVALAAYGVYALMKQKNTSSASFVGDRKFKATTLGCGEGENCEGPAGNLCGESCIDGKCYVPIYGDAYSPKPTSYRLANCGGAFGSGTLRK